MDMREAKLALARKKLRDHQEKKLTTTQKDETVEQHYNNGENKNNIHDAQCIPMPKNDPVDKVDNAEVQIVEKIIETKHNIGGNDLAERQANVTEILISNKRNLELQIIELQNKLLDIDQKYASSLNNYNMSCEKIKMLETEVKNINEKYLNAIEQLESRDNIIKELNTNKSSLSEENNNLLEQLELTKSIVKAKEAENDSLHSQLYNLQNQFDVTQLQIQQLMSGSQPPSSNDQNNYRQDQEILQQKVSSLEQKLKALQKERDQIGLHYENYVRDLNEQLKSLANEKETMSLKINDLSNREISLVEQIGNLEIRLQSYMNYKKSFEERPSDINIELNEWKQKYEVLQEKHNEVNSKYIELQKLYSECNVKIEELTTLNQAKSAHDHDRISMSKLNADIASDKIAAQRATEQNRKLKCDIQGLEDAFVKMSQDKLELTEKITAEKYLNRELTIKLAEVEEKAKDMQIKLKAKDDEMIRLQSSYRAVEKRHEHTETCSHSESHSGEEVIEDNDKTSENGANLEVNTAHECENENHVHETKPLLESSIIPKEDAMLKLQHRFLKIMEEVADLSDEKHRLEHIILQLQNETDTICEYVALYQQQRSLLKKRDEERSAQIKVFQSECDRLQSHLNELSELLLKFAQDNELVAYFKIEAKHKDLDRAMNLLKDLQNNSLIDRQKNDLEFKNFYPCSCCSGQLIDV